MSLVDSERTDWVERRKDRSDIDSAPSLGRRFEDYGISPFLARRVILMSCDTLAWFAAAAGFVAMGTIEMTSDVATGPGALLAAIGIHLLVAMRFRLYSGRFRTGNASEMPRLGTAALFGGAAFAVSRMAGGADGALPAAVGVTASALLVMMALRLLWRWRIESELRPDPANRQRTIVFGAGRGAFEIVTTLTRNPNSTYVPVALLDDRMRNREIMGVRVVGGRKDIARVAKEYDATDLLFAIPSASDELLREIGQAAHDAGLRVHRLPSTIELVAGTVAESDIRQLTQEELLGRDEIETDLESIVSYLAGKTVLVTGAGGSIGSELCRRIMTFQPARLVMLDRDESALHAVMLSIHGKALLYEDDLVVADIRDRERMFEVFAEEQPDVVFHTAALKHLPLLERYPKEGFFTNVIGSRNVIDAAESVDVECFVNVSTDKAADPSSILGATKRAAERMIAAKKGDPGRYVSVRFGNVLASRGSVLEVFRAQAEQGRNLTVTHPDVTRFFMTIPEAVQLVVQAGAIGQAGETLVLDMGEPVRIAEIAERIAKAAPQPIEIEYTGLRPGEKMHEVLVDGSELLAPTSHELIRSTAVEPLEIAFSALEEVWRGVVDHPVTFELATGGETNQTAPAVPRPVDVADAASQADGDESAELLAD